MTPAAIAALPSELVAKLVEAAMFCEIEVIHQVITEIRRQNAPLADALAHLAEQFEYDEILTLVQGEETHHET